MSRRVRVLLLAGCGLIAALEAREARASLVAGLAGPYARPQASSGPAADRRAALEAPRLPRLLPTLMTLAPEAAFEERPLALGR